MNLIRISESDDWIVDYDKERGMYRVSYFQDNHFVDEFWFDAYEEKEIHVPNAESLLRTLESSKIKTYTKEESIETEERVKEILESKCR